MAIQNGDIEALGSLHARYAPSLHYFFVRSFPGGKAEAADWVQDIFIRIFEKALLFDTKRAFKPWLFSIAHNMVKNEHAKANVRSAYIDAQSQDTYEHSFENDLDHKEKLSLIFQALETVDFKKREQFILRFKVGLSIKEIAEITNSPEGSVKSGLHYSVKKIKQKLGNHEQYE